MGKCTARKIKRLYIGLGYSGVIGWSAEEVGMSDANNEEETKGIEGGYIPLPHGHINPDGSVK